MIFNFPIIISKYLAKSLTHVHGGRGEDLFPIVIIFSNYCIDCRFVLADLI